MPGPLGSLYRAVAPFSLEPPFRLYAGEGHAPVIVDETPQITDADGVELTALVPVKARPVLVITAPSARYGEVLALRLRRLSQMAETAQRTVRSGEDDGLFYLDPDRCPGLDEENAAIVETAMRLSVSALDLGRPLGRIDGDEVRVIHERFARAHQLDLRGVIEDRARDLVAQEPG
jgi:hypothetical protein